MGTLRQQRFILLNFVYLNVLLKITRLQVRATDIHRPWDAILDELEPSSVLEDADDGDDGKTIDSFTANDDDYNQPEEVNYAYEAPWMNDEWYKEIDSAVHQNYPDFAGGLIRRPSSADIRASDRRLFPRGHTIVNRKSRSTKNTRKPRKKGNIFKAVSYLSSKTKHPLGKNAGIKTSKGPKLKMSRKSKGPKNGNGSKNLSSSKSGNDDRPKCIPAGGRPSFKMNSKSRKEGVKTVKSKVPRSGKTKGPRTKKKRKKSFGSSKFKSKGPSKVGLKKGKGSSKQPSKNTKSVTSSPSAVSFKSKGPKRGGVDSSKGTLICPTNPCSEISPCDEGYGALMCIPIPPDGDLVEACIPSEFVELILLLFGAICGDCPVPTMEPSVSVPVDCSPTIPCRRALDGSPGIEFCLVVGPLSLNLCILRENVEILLNITDFGGGCGPCLPILPTLEPTDTALPTIGPTLFPSRDPTATPTIQPTTTTRPTMVPTTTDLPTLSFKPTHAPTSGPTANPTSGPTVTSIPTVTPTSNPTAVSCPGVDACRTDDREIGSYICFIDTFPSLTDSYCVPLDRVRIALLMGGECGRCQVITQQPTLAPTSFVGTQRPTINRDVCNDEEYQCNGANPNFVWFCRYDIDEGITETICIPKIIAALLLLDPRNECGRCGDWNGCSGDVWGGCDNNPNKILICHYDVGANCDTPGEYGSRCVSINGAENHFRVAPPHCDHCGPCWPTPPPVDSCGCSST